jgi:hypothetical protein
MNSSGSGAYVCSRCRGPLGAEWYPMALSETEYTRLRERAETIDHLGQKGWEMYRSCETFRVIGADEWSLFNVRLMLFCKCCWVFMKAYKEKVTHYLLRLTAEHTRCEWEGKVAMTCFAQMMHPWVEGLRLAPNTQVLDMKDVCDPRDPLVFAVKPMWADLDDKYFALPQSWRIFLRPLEDHADRPNYLHSFVKLKLMLSYIWHATLTMSIKPTATNHLNASQVVYAGTGRLLDYKSVEQGLSAEDRRRVQLAIGRIDAALAPLLLGDEKESEKLKNECEIFCVLDPRTTQDQYQMRIVIYHRVRTSLLSEEHKAELAKRLHAWTPEEFASHPATQDLLKEHAVLTDALVKAQTDPVHMSSFVISSHTETLCPLIFAEEEYFPAIETFGRNEHCVYDGTWHLEPQSLTLKCVSVNAFANVSERVGLVDLKTPFVDKLVWPRQPYIMHVKADQNRFVTPVLLEGEGAGATLKEIAEALHPNSEAFELSDARKSWVEIPEVKKYWRTVIDAVEPRRSWN